MSDRSEGGDGGVGVGKGSRAGRGRKCSRDETISHYIPNSDRRSALADNGSQAAWAIASLHLLSPESMSCSEACRPVPSLLLSSVAATSRRPLITLTVFQLPRRGLTLCQGSPMLMAALRKAGTGSWARRQEAPDADRHNSLSSLGLCVIYASAQCPDGTLPSGYSPGTRCSPLSISLGFSVRQNTHSLSSHSRSR